MPHLVNRVLVCVALAFPGMPPVLAQDAPDAEPYVVDSIYDLKQVRDIDLDGAANRVMVTLPHRVLQFSTFPLEVTADVAVNIEGITSVVTDDQDLIVLGDDVNRGLSGGSILIYRDIERSLSEPLEPLVYPLDITPFSQTLLTEENNLYAVNPTWFSIVQASVDDMISFLTESDARNWRPNDLFLQCGTASKVSIFRHEDRDYYVTSLAGTKLIEYGPVELNVQKLPFSDCFSPESSGLTRSIVLNDSGERSLLHDLIDNPWAEKDPAQVPKYLLTFDPENAGLTVFPIREFRGKLAMLRSESYGYELANEYGASGIPSGQFGLLAADDAGSVILVSYFGSDVVHRLRQEDGTLQYAGRLDFPKPVKHLEVSDDGRLAGIVIGDTRRDIPEEIVLIRAPGNIPDLEPLTRSRYTVSNMQKLLNQNDFQLVTDGIYGNQTQQAVDEYLKESRAVEVVPASTTSDATYNMVATTAGDDDDPLGSTRNVEQGKIALPQDEIGRTLRGLFPLENPSTGP